METLEEKLRRIAEETRARQWGDIGLPVGIPAGAPKLDHIRINPTTKFPVVPPLGRLREEDAYKVLGLRLRVPEHSTMPFNHLSLHVGAEVVFVFIVKGDKTVTIEDPADMYPSDQLITQLRLLIG